MKKYINILILSTIFIIFSIIFYAKTGNMLIDFSRESYIPFQLNNGEKLIKDIFLIYGPFGYMINSLLYKFASNINILLIEAHIISYFILILFYLILKKFCKDKIALIFSIIFIAISIFSNTVFSFVLPYSFSSLWGYLGAYLALYCLLNNNKNLLFASLGLILSNKIELFIPIFILSIIVLLLKKEKFAKNAIFILIFPFISYSFLFFENWDINSFSCNINHIIQMTKTNAISSLYKGVGCFFEIRYFKYNLILSAKLLLLSAISYFLFIKNKKFLSYATIFISFLFIYLEFSLNLCGFFLIGLTLYFAIKRKISQNELILIIFSLILCSKSFFAINSLSYSNFGFILVIFAIYLKLKELLDKNWLINSIIVFFSLLFASKMFVYNLENKTKMPTPTGNIWLKKNDAQSFINTNNFIEKNIKKDENFIIVPEGQIFNLIHKKSHNFYNSTFTPLDFETFTDKKITDKLKENKTDYIIIFPRNTKEYGAEDICNNYAVDFCKYVMDNYTQIQTFGENKEVKIYKIKK